MALYIHETGPSTCQPLFFCMAEAVQAGVVRENYFRADRSEAILVLECQTVEEAREALSTLPFVKNQLITFELIPLKAYPGFERLFA